MAGPPRATAERNGGHHVQYLHPQHRIRRHRAVGPSRRARFLGFAALAVVVPLAGCTVSAEPAPGGTASSTTAASTLSPTTAPAERVWVTAYFMVDTRVGLRLARERQSLPDGDVTTAVAAMIAGPVDPDYFTPWNSQTEVLSVSQDAGLITVDLSEDALTASIGSEGAALMIQQLVWTATGAAGQPDAAVALLIEGAAPGDLWGAVRWDEPVVRADPLSVRFSYQLDVPAEGEVFPAGKVTISGEAAAFEAHVPWRITADGVEVLSGYTMTSDSLHLAPFQFTVELKPGEYVVAIIEEQAATGGVADTPMSDTRTFTVTPAGLPGSGV